MKLRRSLYARPVIVRGQRCTESACSIQCVRTQPRRPSVAFKHMTNTSPDADSWPNMTEQPLRYGLLSCTTCSILSLTIHSANRNVITDIMSSPVYADPKSNALHIRICDAGGRVAGG